MLLIRQCYKKTVPWFNLPGHMTRIKATLSLPLLNWTREKKYDEKLMV